MYYAKSDFLIVIISISTFILINVAVLLQTHFQTRIFWKLHQLEGRNFLAKVLGAERSSK